MQKSLYPPEIIGLTAETIMSRHSAKGHIIYITIILGILTLLVLLPILKITISIQSSGIIRPITEKNVIKSLVSGTVSSIFIKENQKVQKNQIILTLNTNVLDEKLKFVNYKINEKKNNVFDLNMLISKSSNRSINIGSFKTMHYKSEYLYYKNKIRENIHNQTKSKKEVERYRYLNKQKLASLSELEYKELKFKNLKIQNDLLKDRHSAKWNKDLLSDQLEIKKMNAQHEQFKKERELYIIKSPINGTIEEFSGISIGSFVQTGQQLIIISPEGDIIAELYVSPHDIGLLRKGIKANIQIEAYNYNQWGLIQGEINEISDDFISINKKPVFRVRCTLKQNYLQLKNGYKGYLKKGMTIRARFLITKRSLFQLLYDTIDDWLNPMLVNKPN